MIEIENVESNDELSRGERKRLAGCMADWKCKRRKGNMHGSSREIARVLVGIASRIFR